MNDNDELKKVGRYNPEFNKILGIHIEELDIFCSTGLSIHMKKRKHFDCLKYVENIPDIIQNPDYIGVNPNEEGHDSIELVKRYDDNVLMGIKLDSDQGHLYVSTMHSVQDSKISRRLHGGRLKEFSLTKEEE